MGTERGRRHRIREKLGGSCGIAAVLIALATRMAHFTGYLLGSRTGLYYWPVLACTKFEAAVESMLLGTGGSGPFVYASPLYRYIILPVYASGAGRTGLFVIQSLLGVITAWMIYRLCLRTGAGRGTSLAASVIWSLYAPAAFYELTILPVSMLAFILTLFALLITAEPVGRAAAAAAGFLAGLAAGLRPPFMAVLAVPLFVWAKRRKWSLLLLSVSSFIVPMIFLSVQHYGSGGGFYPFPRAAGVNLVLGHSSESTGYGPPVPSMGLVETGQGDIHDVAAAVAADSGYGDPASADRFWTGKAVSWILSHPGDELRLMALKLGGFLGARPFDSYYEMGRVGSFNPVFRFFLVPRLMLIVCFLAGLLPFCLRGGHRSAVLVPVAVAAATVVVFVHSERFFLPVLPLITVTAASGLSVLFRCFSRHRIRWTAATLAGLLLLVPSLLYPVPRVPDALYVGSLAVRAYHMEDYPLALELFERSAMISPSGTVPWVQGHREAARISAALGMGERAEQHRRILLQAGIEP